MGFFPEQTTGLNNILLNWADFCPSKDANIGFNKPLRIRGRATRHSSSFWWLNITMYFNIL